MGNWTPEQQKEHRKLWVEALRSGDYKQTKGVLRLDSGFCCLGVACQISGLGAWEQSDDDYFRFNTPTDDRGSDLPNEVREWLGLSGEEGDYINDVGEYSTLAYGNDEGLSFKALSDIIESEPEGLIA